LRDMLINTKKYVKGILWMNIITKLHMKILMVQVGH
jgi:hypothetical protein